LSQKGRMSESNSDSTICRRFITRLLLEWRPQRTHGYAGKLYAIDAVGNE